MPANRYREARQELGWKVFEMASKMGVTPETVSNWESGKRQMTLEKLTLLSEITGLNILYLLGYDSEQIDWLKPLTKKTLALMHRNPVWSKELGWGLVNMISNEVFFAEGQSISISNLTTNLYGFPPALSATQPYFIDPLTRKDVQERSTVWLEPISFDVDLSAELRGWYRIENKRYAENEFGNRFYLDTYEAKWLAFDREYNYIL